MCTFVQCSAIKCKQPRAPYSPSGVIWASQGIPCSEIECKKPHLFLDMLDQLDQELHMLDQFLDMLDQERGC